MFYHVVLHHGSWVPFPSLHWPMGGTSFHELCLGLPCESALRLKELLELPRLVCTSSLRVLLWYPQLPLTSSLLKVSHRTV